jgi:preprotein translocase subunit SecD
VNRAVPFVVSIALAPLVLTGCASSSTANVTPSPAAHHVLAFRQVLTSTATSPSTPSTAAPAAESEPSIPAGASVSFSISVSAPASPRTPPTGPCITINRTSNLPTGCTSGDQLQRQVAALGTCTADKRGAVEALGLDEPAQPLAACARDGSRIYTLAPSYMSGVDVKNASSVDDATQGWLVELSLTSAGARHFGALTTAVTSLAPPLNQVAVVLDGVVESAPIIEQGITGGQAQITGGTSGFTQADADSLAKTLNRT